MPRHAVPGLADRGSHAGEAGERALAPGSLVPAHHRRKLSNGELQQATQPAHEGEDLLVLPQCGVFPPRVLVALQGAEGHACAAGRAAVKCRLGQRPRQGVPKKRPGTPGRLPGPAGAGRRPRPVSTRQRTEHGQDDGWQDAAVLHAAGVGALVTQGAACRANQAHFQQHFHPAPARERRVWAVHETGSALLQGWRHTTPGTLTLGLCPLKVVEARAPSAAECERAAAGACRRSLQTQRIGWSNTWTVPAQLLRCAQSQRALACSPLPPRPVHRAARAKTCHTGAAWTGSCSRHWWAGSVRGQARCMRAVPCWPCLRLAQGVLPPRAAGGRPSVISCQRAAAACSGSATRGRRAEWGGTLHRDSLGAGNGRVFVCAAGRFLQGWWRLRRCRGDGAVQQTDAPDCPRCGSLAGASAGREARGASKGPGQLWHEAASPPCGGLGGTGYTSTWCIVRRQGLELQGCPLHGARWKKAARGTQAAQLRMEVSWQRWVGCKHAPCWPCSAGCATTRQSAASLDGGGK